MYYESFQVTKLTSRHHKIYSVSISNSKNRLLAFALCLMLVNNLIKIDSMVSSYRADIISIKFVADVVTS